MPKLIALVALLTSTWSAADAQAFSPVGQKSFTAESYFCSTNSPALETTAQVKDWFAFLASGRTEELLEAAPGSAPCNGTVQRIVRDGVWHAEGPEALTQIITLASFLGAPPDAPEQRLANDAGVLGWLALACKTFTGAEQACVARAVRDLPQKGLAESPVFCDLAQLPPRRISERSMKGSRIARPGLRFVPLCTALTSQGARRIRGGSACSPRFLPCWLTRKRNNDDN